VDKPIEPPPGCQVIPGFIVVVFAKGWLTKTGRVTFEFSERGVWPTQESAEAARDKFLTPIREK
jgi:hypothetical protein